MITLLLMTTLAADPHLTTDERKQLVQLLEDSRAKLRAAVDGLSLAQWSYQPAEDRWSVGLVAEHIMRTEVGLFGQAQRALGTPENPEWETKTKGKAEFIARAMPSRTTKVQAPLEVRPEGKLSREEVLAQFEKLRARSIDFARTTDRPLKAHTSEHPFPVFGTLNAYQWILYIPWHTERHLKQIEEVKAHAGFPKE